MKILTLGKDHTNDIVMDHNSVSRQKHLGLIIQPDGKVVITHHGTNQTLIDSRPIIKSVLRSEQKIQIGDYRFFGRELIRMINRQLNKERIDFTLEYKRLIELLSEYEEKKIDIAKTSSFIIMIKVVAALILMLIFYFELIRPELKYLFIVGIGIIVTLLGSMSNDKKKKFERKTDLDIEYSDRVRCPKCQNSLLNIPSKKLIARGRCIHTDCNAQFHIH